mgnify:CR=1 FL=1
MKIVLTSIFVNNQDEAQKFYTEKLGFVTKHDFPIGEFKWITVVSSEDEEGTELLLEPSNNPVAKTYQEGIFEQGIPAAAFATKDIKAEFEKLKERGVKFTMEPKKMDQVIVAVFDDTCGNLIQLMQEVK